VATGAVVVAGDVVVGAAVVVGTGADELGDGGGAEVVAEAAEVVGGGVVEVCADASDGEASSEPATSPTATRERGDQHVMPRAGRRR
jgi:hypothetical protein